MQITNMSGHTPHGLHQVTTHKEQASYNSSKLVEPACEPIASYRSAIATVDVVPRPEATLEIPAPVDDTSGYAKPPQSAVNRGANLLRQAQEQSVMASWDRVLLTPDEHRAIRAQVVTCCAENISWRTINANALKTLVRQVCELRSDKDSSSIINMWVEKGHLRYQKILKPGDISEKMVIVPGHAEWMAESLLESNKPRFLSNGCWADPLYLTDRQKAQALCVLENFLQTFAVVAVAQMNISLSEASLARLQDSLPTSIKKRGQPYCQNWVRALPEAKNHLAAIEDGRAIIAAVKE